VAFATIADVVDRFDERTLRDLCSDTGTPAADLNTNGPMLAALETASGTVLVACTVGQMYDEGTLAALEGASRAILVDIVCSLAVARLMTRRPLRPDVAATWKQSIDEANAYLDKFRNGQRVFPLPAQLDASVPSVEGPTMLDIPRNNLLTYRCSGYYPIPALRLPGRT